MKQSVLISTLLFAFIHCFSQIELKSGEVNLGPSWSHNKPIYEVSIERASNEGTFKGFEKKIPELKKLGVGIIWLQPIHQKGSFKIERAYIDSLGGSFIPVPEKVREYQKITSPYNIHDYYSVNPEYGSKNDFKELVNTIHKNRMYVILDFVINHTSWDHVFIREHPEFYKRNEKGAVMFTSPWRDIAQLDYSKKEVWQYMDILMNHWIDEYDIDGFRTDVADRFPPEFWNWIKPRISQKKEIFMLAEGLSPEVYPSHNMTYDWFLPYAFWSVVHGKRKVDAITKVLEWETNHYPEGYRKLRHATNHDTQSHGYAWPTMTQYFDPVFDREWFENVNMNEKFGGGINAFMVLCATLPNGQPMIWTGQEFGTIYKTPKLVPIGVEKPQKFYNQLFDLFSNHPALIYGDFVTIPCSDDSIYCFTRNYADEKITVLLNISDKKRKIDLNNVNVKRGTKEYFSQERIEDTLVEMRPFEYYVFVENKSKE